MPPWASSSAPTLRASPFCGSVPKSSCSIRSGVMVAAFSTTNGPCLRAESSWSVRATSSLPAPEAPEIMMRLLVGAIFSIIERRWFMAADAPRSRLASPERSRSTLISRRSLEASRARSATSTSRSDLNGFSM